MIGRDQSGKLPPLPKDLYWARLEITDLIIGNAEIGKELKVYFGVPGNRYKTPYGKEKEEREYFVISYVGNDNLRRLYGFPISDEEYDRWAKQRLQYELDRLRPGVVDE